MICRTVADLTGTDREASGNRWESRRFMLAEDGLPFPVHETTVAGGSVLRFNYQRHSETVHCVSGGGRITFVGEGSTKPPRPGVCYMVGIGAEHVLETDEETRFVCIFEPPLAGQEEAD